VARLALHLAGGGQTVSFGEFRGTPQPPQNPFLLDGGPGAVQLFVAMLNGQAVDLPAGKQTATSFGLTLEPK
jgi:hypothetical protein